MRVLLTSHGSTGDIFPLIGYGKALLEAGHEVRYATAPLYQEDIEKAGLTFVHMPPDWGKEIFVEFMRELNRAPLPLLQLRHIYTGALPFMGEILERMGPELDWCDVMVSSYFFPHYSSLAALHGKPFATFAFCQNLVPTPERTPEMIPQLRGLPSPLQAKWNLMWWRIGSWLVDLVLNSVCGELFRKYGLPPSKGFLTEPADLCLVAVSPALMDSFEHEDRFKFVGYLRWQSAENNEVERELEAFCEGKEVPVLTFGSVTFDDTHTIMSRFLRAWPHGKKIIIQSGWAGLSVEIERPEIKFVPAMSHDQLFRHASVVIHHGGAGTTASVLHAGKPQIIIPHIADQEWFASEVKRLKVGRRTGKKRWPEKLPYRIRKVEKNPRYRERAEELAEILHNENGRELSVQALETFVQEYSERAKDAPEEPESEDRD